MKKTLAVILTFLMLFSTVSVFAEGETENITVYLSVSKYGEITEDKNGDPMAYAPVALEGQETYTLDDVFRKAHELYYEDGEGGYLSSVGDWGLGIDMLWGDTSYNFGYQVNQGKEAVMGPGHEVTQGDYVDACIYQNLYPDTEGYAFFDIQKTEIMQEEALSLTLSYASGYDENWNTIFSPCEGATILVNGEETEIVTDENGVAEFVSEEEGTYIVSAKKTKILNEKEVPSITAPVCILTVKEDFKKKMIHNIAEYYAEINPEEAGGNLPWIVADMAIYNEVFPESEIDFTEDKKEEIIKSVGETAIKAKRPGDMAKSILALRALGYDARNIYTSDLEYVDVVENLLTLIEEEAESVHNIYTLPYVMIACMQAEEYIDEEQMENLIASALAQKEKWQDVSEGTDAMTPMILALAPFAEEKEEVQAVLDESIEILKSEQREDGLIDGFEGYESASTGLAICALSAVGIHAEDVIKGEKSLIDGLFSTSNEENNGFSNPFATEQGFRGLLSHKLLTEQDGKRMYDFSDYPMEELNLSPIKHCPVFFDVSPTLAQVTVEGYGEIEDNFFDLPEGEHSYQVKRSGYRTEAGTIHVKAKDAENHIRKEVSVTLSAKSGGSSSGGGSYSGGSSDKKPVAEKKEETIPSESVPKEEQTEEKKLPEEMFQDVKQEAWYYPAVSYVCEKKMFSGTDKGFEPDAPMTRGMLATVLYRMEGAEKTEIKQIFTDVAKDAWFGAGVAWCTENGIVNGVSDTVFAPDAYITREQLAVMLYRYAQYKNKDIKADADIESYQDVKGISDYAKEAMRFVVGVNVVSGREGGTLAPKENATRAEVAMMLMRFAEVMK